MVTSIRSTRPRQAQPSTRTTRSKPTRTVRLSPGSDGSRRILSLYVGADAFLYWLEPLASDFGHGYRLEKFTDGTTYDVLLSEDGHHSCECKGHLRWAPRTVCKHVAALVQLRATGKLA